MSLYVEPALYHTLRPVNRGTLETVLGLLERHLPSGARNLLDPACGPGDWLLEFAQRGLRVAGNDYSASMCHCARERLANYPHEIVCGDMRQLSFASGPFDAALELSGVVCELPHADFRIHLLSVSRQLRQGGLYIVSLIEASGATPLSFPVFQYSAQGDGDMPVTKVDYWIDSFDSVEHLVRMRREVSVQGAAELQDRYTLALHDEAEVRHMLTSLPEITLLETVPESVPAVSDASAPAKLLRERLYAFQKSGVGALNSSGVSMTDEVHYETGSADRSQAS